MLYNNNGVRVQLTSMYVLIGVLGFFYNVHLKTTRPVATLLEHLLSTGPPELARPHPLDRVLQPCHQQSMLTSLFPGEVKREQYQ